MATSRSFRSSSAPRRPPSPLPSLPSGRRTTSIDGDSSSSGPDRTIHDAKVDYLGTKLATASSDASVRISDLEPGSGSSGVVVQRFREELRGHVGPVWQLAWAHPSFGSLLASCSYDGSVIIWKEVEAAGRAGGKWEVHYRYENRISINSVSWAPAEWGLMLACGSSDSSIIVLSFQQDQDQWKASRIYNAHVLGCLSVCWPPSVPSHLLKSKNPNPMCFASGGCDNLVKIWKEEEDGSEYGWVRDVKLIGHIDWVQDVAWSPGAAALQPNTITIASGSQDRRVIVWNIQNETKNWCLEVVNLFDAVVWSVNWSLVGDVLVVSSGEGQVTLWRKNHALLEGVEVDGATVEVGNWECLNSNENDGDKNKDQNDALQHAYAYARGNPPVAPAPPASFTSTSLV